MFGKIYAKIDKHEVDLLTLDIFDTLIRRKLPEPEDVFLLLGQQLVNEGWLVPALNAELFADIRILAAQIAKKLKPEPNLREIYYQMAGIFPKIEIEEMIQGKNGIINESDVDTLANFEFALDKKLSFLDPEILKLLQYALSKNIPVHLVSNTFYTEDQLKEFIQIPVTRIFSSCDLGMKKSDGLLKLAIEGYKKPFHIGDNPTEDIEVAKKLKIPSFFYEKYDPEFEKILRDEWPDFPTRERRERLDPQNGDFGLSTLRGNMYHNNTNFFWRYGATVIGPMLAGFISWVEKRAKELHATEVFCLMREGGHYAELIKTVKAHKLWASRRYLIRSCIFQGNEEELSLLLNTHAAVPYTVDSFCRLLGVDPLSNPFFTKNRYVRMEDAHFNQRVIKELESYRQTILETSAAHRKKLLKYLKKHVDFSKPIVIVDVGWNGTIQGMLQKILKFEGYPTHIHGLYLCTQMSTQFSLMQGYTREGYLIKGGYPEDALRAIKMGHFIMEQASLDDQGSLKEIDDEGDVILEECDKSKTQIAQARLVRQGVDDFIKTIGTLPDSTQLCDQLRAIFVRSTCMPTKREAEHFATWTHDHFSGRTEYSSAQLIAKGYNEKMIGALLPSALLNDPDFTWPPGYAATYDPNWAKAIYPVVTKKIPEDSFLSHNAEHVKVYIDYGKGFPKKASETWELHRNANHEGFTYRRIRSLSKAIKGIKFEIKSKTDIEIGIYRKQVSDVIKIESDTKKVFKFKDEDIYGLNISLALI